MWLLFKIIYHMIKFKGAITKLEKDAARAYDRPARLDRLRTYCRHLRGVDSHLTRIHEFIESDLPGDRRLGLWGLRGAGKSSLLMQLRQRYPYHALFDRVLYVACGSRRSVTDVQLRICCASLDFSYDLMAAEDVRTRARVIRSDLERKSFLLLLDELEAPIDLAAVGVPMPLGMGGRPQKIVVATRNRDVCALMGCADDNTVKVRRLGEDDAWGFFVECVGGRILGDPVIESLAKEMAQACEGLPLTLDRLGCGMSSNAIDDADIWMYMHRYLKARLPLTQEQLLDLVNNIRHW